MRRRLFASLFGLISVFVLAGPAFADTTPTPNYRDSGSGEYVNAFASECGQSTCTDTFVYGTNVDLQSGDDYSYVCVDQFTYPIRGGGRFLSLSGCADTGINVASDLSSASADATILAESCGRHSCSTEEITVSLSLTAVGDPIAYSYTSRNKFGNCVDTYRVRGSAADAEGTLDVDGTSLSAFGQIGSEDFAFSTRCR